MVEMAEKIVINDALSDLERTMTRISASSSDVEPSNNEFSYPHNVLGKFSVHVVGQSGPCMSLHLN